jgi:outer membrane protein assembly factor BamD (BamD/ComL family)
VRQRFPGSAAASDAAFLLGRLGEPGFGAASEAGEWYARYLRESPRGPYAVQALGRSMLHVYREQGAVAARSSAERYLQRHPSGPHADSARRIAAEALRAPQR